MNSITELLKEILVSTHRGSAYEVAEIAGLAYRTVIDQTDGRINPSVEVIKASWLVTKDPRLKRLLEPEGWELARKAEMVQPTRDAEGETTDVILAASTLIESIRKAKEDGRLTKEERLTILSNLGIVKLEVEEAEAALNKEISSMAGPRLNVAGTGK